jgi:hypothetical protein
MKAQAAIQRVGFVINSERATLDSPHNFIIHK